MLKVVVAFTLALAPGSLGAPAADEVKSLPGWDKPLPTKHYSGYIPVNSSTRHMHCTSTSASGIPLHPRTVPTPVLPAMSVLTGCSSGDRELRSQSPVSARLLPNV